MKGIPSQGKNFVFYKSPGQSFKGFKREIIMIRFTFFKRLFCLLHVGFAQLLQLCLTFCDPMDYSPPVFSVHGISQARILEWVAISFSRGSSQPKD